MKNLEVDGNLKLIQEHVQDPIASEKRHVASESESKGYSGFGGMSLSDLKSQIESGANGNRETHVGAIFAFARKSGRSGRPEDLEFLVNCSGDLSSIRSAVDLFFEEYGKAGGKGNIEMLAGVRPGHKRDCVIMSLFRSSDMSVGQAIELIDELPFPEDRGNAFGGLASSRLWEAEELRTLVKTHNIDVLDPPIRGSIQNAFFERDHAWLDKTWSEVSRIDNDDERLIIARVFIAAVGLKEPERGAKFLDEMPQDQRSEMLEGPDLAKFIESWAYNDPAKCLNYIEVQNLSSATSSRLVSRALGQWLAVDSMKASEWVTSNLNKPYAEPAVSRVVRWLEQRGEDASAWKNTLEKIRADAGSH